MARIKAYRNGSQTLNQLSQDLDALGLAAAEFDAGWHAQFRRAWAPLEDANAVLLDEGGRQPTDSELRLIDESLGEIERLAGALAD